MVPAPYPLREQKPAISRGVRIPYGPYRHAWLRENRIGTRVRRVTDAPKEQAVQTPVQPCVRFANPS